MNKFKFLVPILIAICFIPLPTKGFLKAFFVLSKTDNVYSFKPDAFFNKFDPIVIRSASLSTGLELKISDLPVDLSESLNRLAYKKNTSLFQISKDYFYPTKVRFKLPQKFQYWSLQPKLHDAQIQQLDLQKILTAVLNQDNANQIFTLPPNANREVKYRTDTILNFYFKGRSHQIPFAILEPYIIQNQAGQHTVDLAGFKKLHQILDLPFSLVDTVHIQAEPLQIKHSFADQIIDHSNLSKQLNEGLVDINLSFENPLVRVKSQDQNYRYQSASIKTKFYGSPTSRVHNIQVGAKHLQTFILDSQSQFSINRSLGEVSAKTGYRKGLVITSKGILPEYGGGLCQVSTSIYRAALVTGMQILERYPHSHAVSYYAQELGHGLDAAIYLGVKDLKFANPHDYPVLFELISSDFELQVNTYGPIVHNYNFSNYKQYDFVSPTHTRHLFDSTAKNPEVVMEAIRGFKTQWTLDRDGKSSQIYAHYQAKPLTIKTAAIPERQS